MLDILLLCQQMSTDALGILIYSIEPAGIKEILINHITSESSGMEDVEDWCLELLQKHDPAFVEEWRARETTDNSEA